MENIQDLSLEINGLKRIVFELSKREREDYLTYEEGLAHDEAMKDLREGRTFTIEDIQNERKKLGLGI